MNSLAIRLVAAFAVVILVALGVVIVVANRATAQEFEHFMFQGRMVAAREMQDTLADYYARNGSWAGVQRLLADSGSGMMGNTGGMMEGMMGSSRLRVVDAQTRQVVGDSARTDVGQSVSSQAYDDGLPITVNGRLVGALLVEGIIMGNPQTDALQAEFLGRVNRAVFLAGLTASAVGLLLGAVLVRQITAPLGELADAAGRIAGGDLRTRVRVSGDDELGEVGSAFNQMATSLDRQEDLRRGLMADIAHELRTPISVIQGQAEALQDGVFPLSADGLEPIHNNALLLSRLVDDLRTLAHAEAGRLELNRQPVDLTEVVDDLFEDLRRKADDKGVTLTADVAVDLPPVDADPQRLRQVLLNLLSNALRHTPSGGTVSVQYTVNGEQLPVTSEQWSESDRLFTGHWLLVTVKDSGPGIAPEDVPHIFDRFYRGDESRSRQTGGMGLGLAIAKQLIEVHAGQIWAESAGPDEGSAFMFTLPLDEFDTGQSHLTTGPGA